MWFEGDWKEEKPARKDETKYLPPVPTFERPTVLRETLAQRLERQGSKAEQLREKRTQEVEKQLKNVGGRTSQSLGLQIRKEEANRKKALEAMSRARERIDERRT